MNCLNQYLENLECHTGISSGDVLDNDLVFNVDSNVLNFSGKSVEYLNLFLNKDMYKASQWK